MSSRQAAPESSASPDAPQAPTSREDDEHAQQSPTSARDDGADGGTSPDAGDGDGSDSRRPSRSTRDDIADSAKALVDADDGDHTDGGDPTDGDDSDSSDDSDSGDDTERDASPPDGDDTTPRPAGSPRRDADTPRPGGAARESERASSSSTGSGRGAGARRSKASAKDTGHALVLEDESGEAAAAEVRHELSKAEPDRKVERLRKRIDQRQEQFRLGHWDSLSWRQLLWLYPTRLALLVGRRIIGDKLLIRASSLAFFTVLSVIPLLAVAASLLVAFGGEDGGGSVVLEQLESVLLPVAGQDVSVYITDAIERATTSSVGAAGGLALVFTAIMLFFHIERVFNDSWRVEQRRPIHVRILLFYTLITLGPMAISVSIYDAGVASVIGTGFLGRIAYSLRPFLVNIAAFIFAFKFIPHTRVRWRPAFVAAFLTALVFEVAKIGFSMYATNALEGEFDILYGPLVLIPLFLVWVYVSWIVVLTGNLTAYCVQHMEDLMLHEKAEGSSYDSDRDAVVGSSLAALEIFAPIARGFVSGRGPIPLQRVRAESGHGARAVAAVLRRFEDANIVLEVENEDGNGYVPARPLSDITLEEILETLEIDLHKPELTPELRSLVVRVRGSQSKAIGDLTARDLVGERKGGGRKRESGGRR